MISNDINFTVYLKLLTTAKFAWSSPFIMNATVLGINYTGKLDLEKYLSLVESFNVISSVHL
jgi:hypothetical protein